MRGVRGFAALAASRTSIIFRNLKVLRVLAALEFY